VAMKRYVAAGMVLLLMFTLAPLSAFAVSDKDKETGTGTVTSAPTDSFWLNKFNEYDEAQSKAFNGKGYTGPFVDVPYAPSDRYGWDESYVLKGYMGAYLATKDTTYLDKLTEDFDTMIKQLHDDDKDGFLGWWTTKYSLPLIFGGNMETDSIYYKENDSSGKQVSYMADNWYPTPWYGKKDNIYRTDAEKASGKYSTAVVNDGKEFWAAYTILPSYTGNKRYAVTFDGKTANPNDKGKVMVYVQETGQKLGEFLFSGTDWKSYTFDFTTPAKEGMHIRVYTTNEDFTKAGAISYFDNVNVVQYAEYVEHEGMVLDPIAEFILTVNNDKTLNKKYKLRAELYLKLIEKQFYARWNTLWKQWDDNGVPKGVILFPDDDSARIGSIQEYYPFNIRSGGVSLPHNRYTIAARTILKLYSITGKKEYLDKAVRMGNFFKSTLKEKQTPNGKTGYIFQYWNPSGQIWDFGYTRVKSEDISHGNLELGLAIELHNLGKVFTDEDLGKFANTFKYLLFNGDLNDPKVHEFVDGTGNQNYPILISEWQSLSQFDPEVLDITKALLKRSNQGYGPTYGLINIGNLLKLHPELLNEK
jgi:hypothetical protein